MKDDCWVINCKECERSGRGWLMYYPTILTFALRDRGQSRTISVRVTDIPAEIQIAHHQNSIHKCYLLNQSVLSLVWMRNALRISTYRLLLLSLSINLIYFAITISYSISSLIAPHFQPLTILLCTFSSRDLPLSIFMFPGFFHWAHF
jgi:hypothetical protein